MLRLAREISLVLSRCLLGSVQGGSTPWASHCIGLGSLTTRHPAGRDKDRGRLSLLIPLRQHASSIAGGGNALAIRLLNRNP